MKRFTFLLIALIAGAFAMTMNAQPEKPQMRSTIYSSLPDGFEQVGETSLYYNISERYAMGPGYKYGISLLGEIDGQYYSSTYESYGEGAGFIAAFQVNNYTTYLNAKTGTTSEDGAVTMTARVEGQGDVCARIVYSLTNNTGEAVTVNAGVWADVMIGDNDRAPLSRLKNEDGITYGIRMKHANTETSPLLCALFGGGITGVDAADDYWFGNYYTNYTANAIVGNYSSGSNYMQENGSYDSGLGFCWKNRTIEPYETIELSYLISVGEVEFDPIIDPDQPGQDIFTYEVEAINFDGWNDLSLAHPAHIWGHYEHPYGQEAYIEYRVDGADRNWTGEWTRIEEPMVSGEDYDLHFDMFFNPDEDQIHTLELRFTLGLGNYTELNGLEWEDIRSLSFTVDPAVQVYDGTPKTFLVTVGGLDEYNITYTEPGDYSESIWGIFEYETIGINTVEFSIVPGQARIEVEVPENTEFDGEAHPAIVTVIEGDNQPIVTYINTANNDEVLTEAPVNPGVYVVMVEVPSTDYYNGIQYGSYGQFEIYLITGVEELNINNEDNGAWYTVDGKRVVAPVEPGLYIHNGKKYIVK